MDEPDEKATRLAILRLYRQLRRTTVGSPAYHALIAQIRARVDAQKGPLAMSDKLAGVHPRLVAKVGQLQQAMTALGFPMIVTDGVRTVAEQQALYAQGRTTPGHIVTMDDGIHVKSNHQLHADGLGHAIDMAFLDRNGRPSWDEHYPWHAYGECAKALGLRWGGDFTSISDRPHVELPDGP